MVLVFSIFAVVALAGFPGQRQDIPMPSLRTGPKTAMVICPAHAKPGERFPIIGYGHGDTVSPNAYRPALQFMADEGFCCVAYRSCEDDDSCDDGRADFIEMLKMFKHLDGMEPSDEWPFDMKKPLSVAGHSTGGREVLMIAALKNRNSTGYMEKTPEYKLLTPDLAAILPRIKAVCADHPDEMYADMHAWSGEVDNPDPSHFKIMDVPTLIWTGSQDDWIEPVNSSWRNFNDYLESPERVFIDVLGEGHMRVMGDRPFSAHAFTQFFKLYAFNDTSKKDYFFGSPPGIWSQSSNPKPSNKNPTSVPIAASPGAQNAAEWRNVTSGGGQGSGEGSGNEKDQLVAYAGYVGCSASFGDSSVPANQTKLCDAPRRYSWMSKAWPMAQWNIPERCRVVLEGSPNGSGNYHSGKYTGQNGRSVPSNC